jgi:flagellar biosynthesis/type III secretory pathway protein FliH
VDHEEELIIQKDDRLSRGDCIVESDFGIVDAKIDTQLQIIKESFADAGVGRSYET